MTLQAYRGFFTRATPKNRQSSSYAQFHPAHLCAITGAYLSREHTSVSARKEQTFHCSPVHQETPRLEDNRRVQHGPLHHAMADHRAGTSRRGQPYPRSARSPRKRPRLARVRTATRRASSPGRNLRRPRPRRRALQHAPFARARRLPALWLGQAGAGLAPLLPMRPRAGGSL